MSFNINLPPVASHSTNASGTAAQPLSPEKTSLSAVAAGLPPHEAAKLEPYLGKKPNGMLREAITNKDHETLGILLSSGLVDANAPWSLPPLTLAAIGGHIECIDLLVKYRADLHKIDNCQFMTALGRACTEGHIAALQRLIEHGADVNLYASENDLSPRP